eukprot:Nk52_evm15s225 gene=Nk52_evmTU15s225
MNSSVEKIVASECLLEVGKLAMESEQGHAEATYGLYRVALSGIMQGGPDPKSAFKYMKKCVTQSLHPFYSLKLAECYYRGIGVEEDKETAMKIFPRIAEYVRHEDSDFEVWLFSLAMYIQIEDNKDSLDVDSDRGEMDKLKAALLRESDLVKFVKEPHGVHVSSLFNFIVGKSILCRALKNISEAEAVNYFEKAHQSGCKKNALAYVGYCQVMGIGMSLEESKRPGKCEECLEGMKKLVECCDDEQLCQDKEVKSILDSTNVRLVFEQGKEDVAALAKAMFEKQMEEREAIAEILADTISQFEAEIKTLKKIWMSKKNIQRVSPTRVYV